MGFFSWLFNWIRGLFLKKNMELCMLGLSRVGKTSFVNLLSTGDFKEDVVPTVGFNMRKVQRGGIVMKIWDVGGQKRFHGMWERYCRGVEAIVFVVDAAEPSSFAEVSAVLRDLLQKPSIEDVPILLIGNKIDLNTAVSADELRAALNLQSFASRREIAVYMMSCKTKANFAEVVDWLAQHSR